MPDSNCEPLSSPPPPKPASTVIDIVTSSKNKSSSEMDCFPDHGSIGYSPAALGCTGVANSNGTLNIPDNLPNNVNNNNNNSNINTSNSRITRNNSCNRSSSQVDPADLDPCLRSFKACCKKKANCGLEDLFWILVLLIIIGFIIAKTTTLRTIPWSQIFYLMLSSILLLIILYMLATAFKKFVLEDSTTAHWNAHARFTQAAIQSRLREEEQRVHVIAPPKMGGAKLNIIYSVGDVPLARDNSSKTSRQPSCGSICQPNALGNLAQQSISTATASIISTTALTATPSISPIITTNNSHSRFEHRLENKLTSLSSAGGGGCGTGTAITTGDSKLEPCNSPPSATGHSSHSSPHFAYPLSPSTHLPAHQETIEEERGETPSINNNSNHKNQNGNGLSSSSAPSSSSSSFSSSTSASNSPQPPNPNCNGNNNNNDDNSGIIENHHQT